MNKRTASPKMTATKTSITITMTPDEFLIVREALLDRLNKERVMISKMSATERATIDALLDGFNRGQDKMKWFPTTDGGML